MCPTHTLAGRAGASSLAWTGRRNDPLPDPFDRLRTTPPPDDGGEGVRGRAGRQG